MTSSTVVPRLVLCDLDGVVWLAGIAVPGAPQAVARLRACGSRVLLVTNNSSATLAMQEAALADIGIPAGGDVVSSAAAAATLIDPGSRVLVCGGPGVVEALERRDVTTLDRAAAAGERVDAVVVGFHRDFDYEEMRLAADAVRAGALLIATNSDATYPTPHGPIPGGGAIVASIAVAAGVEPVVAGKPHEPMAIAVADALHVERASLTGALVVGDRPETDGAFASTLGCRFALVRTGVTPPGAPLPAGVAPDLDVPDLAAVASLTGE